MEFGAFVDHVCRGESFVYFQDAPATTGGLIATIPDFFKSIKSVRTVMSPLNQT